MSRLWQAQRAFYLKWKYSNVELESCLVRLMLCFLGWRREYNAAEPPLGPIRGYVFPCVKPVADVLKGFTSCYSVVYQLYLRGEQEGVVMRGICI